MTKEKLEQFRLNLLTQLEAAKGYSVLEGELLLGARYAGFRSIENDSVRSELDYLQGAGLVAEEAKLISPEVKRWKLTKSGRDYLATLNS